MADNGRESSMEEILSSIKRIIAEDKAVEIDRPSTQTTPAMKPTLQAVPDTHADDDDAVLELTNEIDGADASTSSDASGVFGDRRKAPRNQESGRQAGSEQARLIDDQKLDSMRQSLSALVEMDGANKPAPVKQSSGTSLEDLTREMMRPMLKQWLDQNLPQLVEELVAREIQRISEE